MLSGIGKAGYMIAHELNNLLTPVSSYAELALQNPKDTALAEKALQKAVLNCRKAREIMQSILNSANGNTNKKEKLKLITLIEEAFKCLGRDFSKDGITVDIRVDDTLHVEVSAVEIQQVMMNLILNARNAMLPGGGILKIEASRTDKAVIIAVSDTGRGIEPSNLEKIFDPFFTMSAGTDSAAASGAGLGLSFCRDVIERHGGKIRVQSTPGRASKFEIVLPKN